VDDKNLGAVFVTYRRNVIACALFNLCYITQPPFLRGGMSRLRLGRKVYHRSQKCRYEKQIVLFLGYSGLNIYSSNQKPSFRSRIHKISYILEPVIDRRSDENQIVGIELALETLPLCGLIHFSFAKIDI
jgi:hypothetical protein